MSDFNIGGLNWSVGLVSAAGAGKSTMVATFPGQRFVFDFDDKMAAYEGTDTFYHTFLDDPGKPVAHVMAKRLLDTAISNNGTIFMDEEGGFFNDMDWALESHSDGVVSLTPDVWVIDSVTGMEKTSMEQGLVDDSRSKSPADGPAKHHYAYAMTRTQQILDKFKMLPGSRIVTFHFEVLDIIKNEAVVDTRHYPLMVGKTRFRMQKEFGEWFHLFTEMEDGTAKHLMYTHRADHINAHTTLGFDTVSKTHIFDDIEVPDFVHLIGKIDRYRGR
jgi:hypothetical protein